jgi:hypothetical protein
LVSEGLKQCNLSLRKELRLDAAQGDHANRDAFSHQGDAKDRMETPASRVFATLRIFLRLLLQVSDMDSPAIEKRSARGCPRIIGRDSTLIGP